MLIARLKPGLALLALAASLLGTSAAALKVGDATPDLTSFKLEGPLPTSLQGKVVLLDFWASWCDPCKASFPVMERLHQQFGPQGLVILAVNVDENKNDMTDFLKKNAVTFAVVRDATQKLVEKVGIATMPSTFLIDRQGKVRFMHSGFRGHETQLKYEQEIQTLLKK